MHNLSTMIVMAVAHLSPLIGLVVFVPAYIHRSVIDLLLKSCCLELLQHG